MPFPEEYAGKDINDICVISLDTFAAGCISAYAGNGTLGRLLTKRNLSNFCVRKLI